MGTVFSFLCLLCLCRFATFRIQAVQRCVAQPACSAMRSIAGRLVRALVKSAAQVEFCDRARSSVGQSRGLIILWS